MEGIVFTFSLHIDLDLETGTKPFHMTLRVKMRHHHTKFHEERLNGSEDIRTNIPRGFEPLP